MSYDFEEHRIKERIERMLGMITNGQAKASDLVQRLQIEYLVRAIDEYDTSSKGRTDQFELRLSMNTGKITQIYFTPEYQDKNIPTGQHVSHPRIPIGNFLIINMGPNILRFSTNRYPEDVDLRSKLLDQEFKNIPTGRRNTIYSLFMRCDEDTARTDQAITYTDVRVEFIY